MAVGTRLLRKSKGRETMLSILTIISSPPVATLGLVYLKDKSFTLRVLDQHNRELKTLSLPAHFVVPVRSELDARQNARQNFGAGFRIDPVKRQIHSLQVVNTSQTGVSEIILRSESFSGKLMLVKRIDCRLENDSCTFGILDGAPVLALRRNKSNRLELLHPETSSRHRERLLKSIRQFLEPKEVAAQNTFAREKLELLKTSQWIDLSFPDYSFEFSKVTLQNSRNSMKGFVSPAIRTIQVSGRNYRVPMSTGQTMAGLSITWNRKLIFSPGPTHENPFLKERWIDKVAPFPSSSVVVFDPASGATKQFLGACFGFGV
jgi:hypothetical protein